MSSSDAQRFQALVGDRRYDVVVDGDVLHLDGATMPYSFERLGDGRYLLLLDGQSQPVFIEPLPSGLLRVTSGGRQTEVRVKDDRALLLERFGLDAADTAAVREVRAPMPGLVLSVLVEPGDSVNAGDGLVVLEAMKMENELRAPGPAVIKAVHVEPGHAVGKNALLLELE